MTPKRYSLTIRDAAERAGVSVGKMRRLVRAKQIEHVNWGRLRFAPEDVDTWVARHRVAAQQSAQQSSGPLARNAPSRRRRRTEADEVLPMPAERRFA